MDRLREQMVNFLSAHQVGLLSVAGPEGVWAMPVRYRNDQLQVECLLPRWADAGYYLEQDPRASLVILESAGEASSMRWLRYTGSAELLSAPAWAETGAIPPAHPSTDLSFLSGFRLRAGVAELYHVIRLTPRRLDLFDESQGWGARETLDI